MQNRRDFLKLASLSAAATTLPVPELRTARVTNSAQKPIVLLRSSWNDHNIGDQRHTPGTLRLLQRYIPEADILPWHQDPRPETEKSLPGISRP